MFCIQLASALVLAKRGEDPEYVILLPSEKQPYHNYCAQQLVKGISGITGVTIPITTGRDYESFGDVPPKAIYLYESNYSRRIYDNELHDLAEDSFEVVVKGENVVICGGSRGVIYGVYDILERYGHYRYYAEWMEVVPAAATFELPDKLKYKEKAYYYYRELLFSETAYTPESASRFRQNAGDTYTIDVHGGRLNAVQGSYTGLLNKVKKYPIADYPEYYCLLSTGKRSSMHVCLSNDYVFAIIRDNFLDQLSKTSGTFYHNLEQADGWDHCMCPKCKAKYEKYGSRYSGVQIEFLNRIAKYVESNGYPNARIRTYAYVYTLPPPKNIKPHRMLHFRIAPLEISFAHPVNESSFSHNVALVEYMEEWHKLTPNLNIYDYTINYAHPMLMYPNHQVLAPNIRFYAHYKVDGYLADDYYPGYLHDPVQYLFTPYYHQFMAEYKLYLLSKLLWNPYANDTYITKEFVRGYYGPTAAPYVLQFIEELKATGAAIPQYMNCLIYPDSLLNQSFVDHCRWLWDRAYEGAIADKAIDDRFEYNVKMSRLSPITNQYYLFRNHPMDFEFLETGVRASISEYKREVLNELINTCFTNSPRVIHCSPGIYMSDFEDYKSTLKRWVDVVNSQTISTSQIKAIVAEQVSGRCGYLSFQGHNYIDGKHGGIDTIPLSGEFGNIVRTNSIACMLLSQSATTTSNIYSYTDSRKVNVTKAYSVSGDQLTFTSTYTNLLTSDNTLNPIWQFTFALGVGEKVAWRFGSKAWRSEALRGDTAFDFYGSADDVSGTFTVCDPTTKRGVQITIPSGKLFSHLLIGLNRTSQTTTVYIYTEGMTIPASGNVQHQFVITPLAGVTGYTDPDVEPTPAGSYERINLVDLLIPYNSGEQKSNVFVVDTNSKTGRAMENGQRWGHQILLYPSGLLKYVVPGAAYNITFVASCQVDPDSTNTQGAWYGWSLGSTDYILSTSTKNVEDSVYYHYKLVNMPMRMVDDNRAMYWNTSPGCKTTRIERIELIRVEPTPTPAPAHVYIEEKLPPEPEVDPSQYMSTQVWFDKDPPKSKSKDHTAAFAVLGVVLGLVAIFVGAVVYFKLRKQSDESSTVVKASIIQT